MLPIIFLFFKCNNKIAIVAIKHKRLIRNDKQLKVRSHQLKHLFQEQKEKKKMMQKHGRGRGVCCHYLLRQKSCVWIYSKLSCLIHYVNQNRHPQNTKKTNFGRTGPVLSQIDNKQQAKLPDFVKQYFWELWMIKI